MPVRKYRSVTEMPAVRPLPPLEPRNLAIACDLSELTFALRPWSFEPGVRKYRSIEEAQNYRQELERRRVGGRVTA
jgi:hypothetical protein